MENIPTTTPKTTSKALKWALVVTFVIVLNLFFNYAISLFYHQPEYETYCLRTQVTEEITSKEMCVDRGGAWSDYGSAVSGPQIAPVKPIPAGTPTGYCDPNFTCQKSYDAGVKSYNRIVFIIGQQSNDALW